MITLGEGVFFGGDTVAKDILSSGITGHVHWNYASHPVDSTYMRDKVSSLKLDVLVHGEIGMDKLSYFLAFSRFSHRSIVFWGHAVTSGIVDRASLRDGVDDAFRGGPDYFVSSILFEDTRVGGRKCAQAKYTERLVLMKVMVK